MEQISKADAHVMGRKTYQDDDEAAWPETRVARGDLAAESGIVVQIYRRKHC